MYPYVDSNGLHCGHDRSTNLSLIKTMAGMILMYSIVCNSHEKKGNQVCSLNSLITLIVDYAPRVNLTREELLEFIVNVICKQLSISDVQLTFNQKGNNWIAIG
ncbi:hypothetical protein CSV69_15690 [Sporosarcina sp. P26b]|nr:hypothetical protein CSV69_15690 [Sporosarcina sp. P26b]